MTSKIPIGYDGSRSPNLQPQPPVPLTPREEKFVAAVARMATEGTLPAPASKKDPKKIKATHIPADLKPIPMPEGWEKKLCHNNP